MPDTQSETESLLDSVYLECTGQPLQSLRTIADVGEAKP